ncbi:TetR family transcriptional regulator [Desulfoluna butyratoxydans]|uniref:Transcription regulator maats c-terminal n=1 Tax=Desulfoluna butyratoxydans TaxID=231438 RepID=A0A4U8YTV8_9BACT|nr:TetR family transcriptional regulator [Desulfoluna butyratoxydans]VFQ46809.1 transcription regulator maats c-terminal [Desulfoluna butyratoxydans]
MARKTKEDAEKTRLGIMDAALTLFDLKGYSRTTLGDIADEAGVSRGAIYWHFQGKEDILAQCCDWVKGTIDDRRFKLTDSEPHTWETVLKALHSYLALLETNTRYARLYRVLKYKVEYTDEMHSFLTSQKLNTEEGIANVTEVFAALAEAGELKPGLDPRLCGISLVSFTWGIVEMWILDKSIMGLTKDGYPLLEMHIDTMKG